MNRNFLGGRYGIDTLGIVTAFAGLFMIRFRYLWIIGIVLFLLAVYRMFSKNISKRYQEQQKFNNILNKLSVIFSREINFVRKLIKSIQGKLSYNMTVYRQRKQFLYFKCPKCKKNLRLPRNKGKLEVTCPVCGFKFQKKT